MKELFQKSKQIHRQLRSCTGIGILASILMLLVPVIVLLLNIPNGGKTGAYDIYEGPIFPMTSIVGADGLSAARKVDFDFAIYGDISRKNRVIITDEYALTNVTPEPVSAKLAYGFIGQLTADRELIPTITVDNALVDAQLFPSVDNQGSIHHADDWAELQKMFLNNNFLGSAISEPPESLEKVIVYHFTDLKYTGNDMVENLFLDVSFDLKDETTKVLKYGAINHIVDEESGRNHMAIQIPTIPEMNWLQDQGFLIVLGSDVLDMRIKGNNGYEIKTQNELDTVSYSLERYEATFSEVIWALANEYDSWEKYDHAETSTLDTPIILYDGAMKRIVASDYEIANDDIGEIFGDVMSEIRMLYWVFSVKILPGETIKVTVEYQKEASKDITGPNKTRDGYDLATRLGSNMHFLKQSASISNAHLIAIVDQNFGFDPNGGITQVVLDIINVEHYFLDVRGKDD